MNHPEFTEPELIELAETICGKVDSLQEIVDSPNVTHQQTNREVQKAITELASLNKKLRPFYKK